MILRLMRKDLMLSWTMPLWMAGALALNVVIQTFEETLPVSTLGFGSFIAGFLPVMISGREDRFRTNALACSLPASRWQIVLARYLVGPALYPLWVVFWTLLAWPFSGGRFPVEMLRADTLAAGFAVLVLTTAVLTPLIIRFGFNGFLYSLIGLQVVGLFVLLAGPRFGLRGGILAIEDAVKGIGPGLRALRASMGDAAFFPAASAAVVAAFGLSCLASCAMFRRRDL
jgi:hypothetical protein